MCFMGLFRTAVSDVSDDSRKRLAGKTGSMQPAPQAERQNRKLRGGCAGMQCSGGRPGVWLGPVWELGTARVRSLRGEQATAKNGESGPRAGGVGGAGSGQSVESETMARCANLGPCAC
jgi:hypothetical protein